MYNNIDVQNKKQITTFGNSSNFGMNTQPNGITPQMQAQIDGAAINDAVGKVGESATDSYLGQRVTSFSDIDPTIQFGVAIPTWIAMNKIMDVYSKRISGDYDKSLIGKIGNFGDKTSKVLFDNPVGRTLNKASNGIKNFFRRTFYDNSALVRAFSDTPSKPENALVKPQAEGVHAMISQDIMNVSEKFLEPVKCAKDLDYLGFSNTEIKRIEAELNKIVKPENKELFLQTEEFKKLCPKLNKNTHNNFQALPPAERIKVLKELKVTQVLNFRNMQEFEAIKASPEKYRTRLLEILKKADKKYFARISYSNKNMATTLKGELIGRKVYLSELYNKLYATIGGGQKSALGRGLVKLINPIIEGATSRAAGGKLAAGMQALFLAEVLIRANRQEGLDNKFKSFMERFAELIGFFVFMPPAIKLMHKVGGLQYSGMTKQQIEDYRKAVIEFNQHVMNKDWSRAEYKNQKKILRSKFRPKTKNPFVWITRKFADILTVGLEQVRPYSIAKVKAVDLNPMTAKVPIGTYFKNVGHRLKDMAINPKYWTKQALGYPIRFALPLLVLVPFGNKILVKGVNAIFGKPKEGALLDEGKEEKLKEEQEKQAAEVAQRQQLLQQQIMMQNANKMAAQTEAKTSSNQAMKPEYTPPVQQMHQTKPEPLIKPQKTVTNNKQAITNESPAKQETKQVVSQQTTPQKSEESKKNDVKRYIPSTNPVIIDKKNDDMTDERIADAIKKADDAEKRANAILSGKFKY